MTSSIQSSSAKILPFVSPAKAAPPPPTKKYNRLAWLKTIKVDRTLRPSVFKTAFEITQYASMETGEFWVSPKTIAEGGEHSTGIAMSEATVVEDMKRLVAAGHLELLERGRRGRGKSGRYRLLTKPQPADIFETDKTSGSEPENLRIASVKPQPADMNHSKNHSSKNHSSAPPARAADVDSQSNPAFVALRRCYPVAPDIGCQDTLNQMLIGGVDIDDILDSACAYIERCHEAGREPKPMISFLKHMQENRV